MIFNVLSNKILWNTLSKYFNKAIMILYSYTRTMLVRNQRTKFVLVRSSHFVRTVRFILTLSELLQCMIYWIAHVNTDDVIGTIDDSGL